VAVKVSAQNTFVVFGGEADTCDAEQDNKYAKRRAWIPPNSPSVSGIGFAGPGAPERFCGRYEATRSCAK
jgi:hypothetical protein